MDLKPIVIQREPAILATQAACPHDRLQLCEGGYVHWWRLREEDGVIYADWDWSQCTDDGDCEYWVECSTCLQRFELPDDWEWN